MNIYEDEALEQKLEELSDQMGLLVLDLLLAGLHKARRETQIFQEFTEAKTQSPNRRDPF
jgi:hypothetical protein